MKQESGLALAGRLVQEAHERMLRRKEQERIDRERILEKVTRLARGRQSENHNLG